MELNVTNLIMFRFGDTYTVSTIECHQFLLHGETAEETNEAQGYEGEGSQ